MNGELEDESMIYELAAFPTCLGLWQDGVRNIFDMPGKMTESWQNLPQSTKSALGLASVAVVAIVVSNK